MALLQVTLTTKLYIKWRLEHLGAIGIMGGFNSILINITSACPLHSCWSRVGFQGGAQQISMPPRCWRPGSVVHLVGELMHLLFIHHICVDGSYDSLYRD